MKRICLLLLLALGTSCSPTVPEPSVCSTETCRGCCQPDGTCSAGDDVLACGAASACQACSSSEVCVLGRCTTATNADSGRSDAGTQDAGAQDAGAQDAGAQGTQDAGAQDAGIPDAGAVEFDAGLPDAGRGDAGVSALDAGQLDAGRDAGVTVTDAGCSPGSVCAPSSLCSASRSCEWDVADLASLDVAPGSLAYDPQRTDYVLVVSPQVSLATVTATLPSGASAVVTVGAASVASGAPVAVPLAGTSTTISVTVRAQSGRTRTYTVVVHQVALPSRQTNYLKASNAQTDDAFGNGLALSADGTTLAIGATGEGSSGAVHVFGHGDAGWFEQARLTVDAGASAQFGEAVALSEGGNVLVVGAPLQTVSGVSGAGSAHVFRRNGAAWQYAAGLRLLFQAPQSSDFFSRGLAMSADAGVIAVGVPGERSACTTGGGCSFTAPSTGAVFLFGANGSSWQQTHFLKASNHEAFDRFGSRVALAADGTTMAVSAPSEASDGTSQTNNAAPMSGAVYVFTHEAGVWSQQAWLKASNAGANDGFGTSLSLAGDGASLAVGAPQEESAGVGTSSALQSDNSLLHAGAVYVFTRTFTGWPQTAYLKASNSGRADVFGQSVSLNMNGSVLAVGAPGEASSGTGVNAATQANDAAAASGASYVFTLLGSAWHQTAYVKASNTDPGDFFAYASALSGDGRTLACGAIGEASLGYDFNGVPAQANNARMRAGAVYVFAP